MYEKSNFRAAYGLPDFYVNLGLKNVFVTQTFHPALALYGQAQRSFVFIPVLLLWLVADGLFYGKVIIKIKDHERQRVNELRRF